MRQIRKHTSQQFDPLTGDPLGPVERLSLRVQGVMRKWRFIFCYTAVTLVWWTHPHWFGDTAADGHWQLVASYMALLIESVVGIGMFGWARRDSVVLRTVHALERQAEQHDEIITGLLAKAVALLEAHQNGASDETG